MDVERVAPSLVPVDVWLKAALGRAVEVLSLIKAGQAPTPGDIAVLSSAADAIRTALAFGEDDASARSLAEYADWHDILRVSHPSADAIALDDLARDLEAVASAPSAGAVLANGRLAEMHKELRGLRTSLARARTYATTTSDVIG